MKYEYKTFESQYKNFLFQFTSKQQAWKNFFENGIIPDGNIIHPEIVASWKRCKKMGLSPYEIRLPSVSPSELQRRQQENKSLIDATQPIFESFAEQMLDSIFTLDLYDKDLIFIKSFGYNTEMLKNREGYSDPGIDRSENLAATTAMLLVKKTGKPFQLVGPEHYDIKLHHSICTSVPIYSPNNDLVGIINIAEKFTPNYSHTLAAMISLSKGVEYNLLQMEKQTKLQELTYYNSAILENMGQAIIVINSNGIIDMSNKAALKLLGMSKHDFIGVSSEDIFGSDNIFLQVLNSSIPVSNREITLTINGKSQYFTGTIVPIVSEESTIHGIIGTINDMPSTKRMLKNIGGWNAKLTFENIIGQSSALIQTIELAKQTAKLPSNTLIQGESGTGKELFAQAIHNESPYQNGPFIAVNCAAIPNALLESELFGYENGAFTGAKKGGQPGKFELAEGGTIFLDEINSMPLDMQVKLLRVIQDKTITRVGGTSSVSLNVKIIAASNANLSELVSQGQFRTDLYYRLNVITISIPPLRDRLEDIQALSSHFLSMQSGSDSTKQIQITDDALNLLKKHSWPGNIRELENLLERAAVQAVISGAYIINAGTLMNFPEFSSQTKKSVSNRIQQYGYNQPVMNTQATEEDMIREAFYMNQCNVCKTAKYLGIARNTLYKKMHKYNITKPD